MKWFLLCFLLISQQMLSAESQDRGALYQDDHIERLQMVRRAKILLRERSMLEKRLESWEIHKRKLIARFERENRVVEEMPLGSDNRYGARLAQKRRSAFYASLRKREARIRGRLHQIEEKLRRLREQFRFRFAVELTREEIFEGKVPRVERKEEKVNMLREYIQYVESYRKLRSENTLEDRPATLRKEITEASAEERNTTQRLGQRLMKIYQYQTMADRIREEFYNRYHIEISDLERAKAFLHNIENAQ